MPDPSPGDPKPADPAAPSAGNPLDQALQRWLLDGRSDPDQTLLRWLLEGRRDGSQSWVGPASGDGPVSGFDPVSVSLVADLKSAVTAAVPSGSGSGVVREPGPDAGVGAGVATGAVPDRVGSYRVVRVAGVGGMGAVFEALDTRLGRRVALKMLRPDGVGSSSEPGLGSSPAESRFAREAVVLAALNHPNIVPVYEVGEHEGRPYLVLEYVPGGSLARWVRGRVLSAREAAQAVADLAGAVGYAHAQGVVHRDLKPGNVLLKPLEESGDRPSSSSLSLPEDPGGDPALSSPPLSSYRLMVADFGLACLGGERAGLTHAGHLLGTPSYMAPEQASGTGTEVGPAADVYALGAILYELLTGHPPFRSETVAGLLRQIQENEPVPPGVLHPGLDRDLETICLKCLEKDPRRRYGSAGDLGSDLGRYLRHEPISARPVRWPGRAWRWCRRNRLAAGLGALACGLVVALGVGGQVSAWSQARLRQQAEQQAQEARRSAEQARQSEALALKAQQFADRSLEGNRRVLRDILSQLQQMSPTDPQVQRIREVCYRVASAWCEETLAEAEAGHPWDAQELQIGRMLAKIWHDQGRLEEAERLLDRCEAAAAHILATHPGDAIVLAELAGLHMTRGNWRFDEKRFPEAVTAYAQGDRPFAERLEREPHDLKLLTYRFSLQGNHAAALLAAGRRRESIAMLEASVETIRGIRRIQPDEAVHRFALAARLLRIGRQEFELGCWDRAAAALEEAKTWYEQVPADHYYRAEAQGGLAECLAFAREAHRRLGDTAAEQADLRALVPLMGAADLRARARMAPIASLLELGDLDAACELATEVMTDSDAPMSQRWDVLTALARGVATPVEPPEEQARRCDRVIAVFEVLHGREGFADLADHERLWQDRAFDPLRGRPGFQRLLAALDPPEVP